MKSYLFIPLFLIGLYSVGYAQTDSITIKVENKIKKARENQVIDSIALSNTFILAPVKIDGIRTFKNKRHQKAYDRLVNHIKKVYPYAKQAAVVLREEERKMVGMNQSARKEHMKQVEKRIEKEFGKEIRNLTFTQGRILLKLIDRETGYTSYELLEELRGTFRAWFYNSIAKMFDYNLKSEFDTDQHLEDRYIDEVVRAIEAGEIKLN